MEIAYLGLGTNIGDRVEYLKRAINLIKGFPKTELIKISRVYETEPWGYTDQNSFLNNCLEIETDLTPYELLEACQEVERELKRERKIKWGPRTIDVDILVYDNIVLNDKDLIIPHPRLQQRAFVLIPLKNLNEELIIKDKTVKEWVKIVGEEGVKEYNSSIIEKL